MFKISDLTRRDMVNIVDGSKLGPIKDVLVDLATGKITALVLESQRKKFGFFSAGGDVVVPWDRVKKIGPHAVLLELDHTHYHFL
ncbi:MAG: YlmC/YmxH family sporulation protein [Bacillota bacterium]|uniref:YlmC/YmxH family sporulation protein n=1 Tax=Desulfurispora thermophila TaxID=265470 RepID=UPI00035CF5A0|nr:YlmC/YmxH family sporulation protein [Desulfurispora thermophila]